MATCDIESGQIWAAGHQGTRGVRHTRSDRAGPTRALINFVPAHPWVAAVLCCSLLSDCLVCPPRPGIPSILSYPVLSNPAALSHRSLSTLSPPLRSLSLLLASLSLPPCSLPPQLTEPTQLSAQPDSLTTPSQITQGRLSHKTHPSPLDDSRPLLPHSHHPSPRSSVVSYRILATKAKAPTPAVAFPTSAHLTHIVRNPPNLPPPPHNSFVNFPSSVSHLRLAPPPPGCLPYFGSFPPP